MAIDTIKSTAVLDGAIATADLANDIAINTSGAITTTGAFTSQGIDDNSNATAITIDSSENVLITKTATGIATVGSELKATGELLATVNNDACAFLNRKSSDGEIINLRKDGSTVGAIGTTGGDVTIDGGSEHTGLRFEGTQITPRHNSAYSNNWTGLGTASNRFKDLYLGDGIYLGGTGAVNKLDDYEEGYYNPTITPGSGSISVNSSHSTLAYTKVGRKVTVTGLIVASTVSSPTGSLLVSLPVVSANLTESAERSNNIVSWWCNGTGAPNGAIYYNSMLFLLTGGLQYVKIYLQGTNGSYDTTPATWIGSGSDMHINFTYFTA